MNDRDMEEIIPLLAEGLKKWEMPIVSHLAEGRRDRVCDKKVGT